MLLFFVTSQHSHPPSPSTLRSPFTLSAQNLVMVAGAAIFALYEVSTALSVRERRRVEGTGQGAITKVAAKVSLSSSLRSKVSATEDKP